MAFVSEPGAHPAVRAWSRVALAALVVLTELAVLRAGYGPEYRQFEGVL
jgi:hypothetical protein